MSSGFSFPLFVPPTTFPVLFLTLPSISHLSLWMLFLRPVLIPTPSSQCIRCISQFYSVAFIYSSFFPVPCDHFYCVFSYLLSEFHLLRRVLFFFLLLVSVYFSSSSCRSGVYFYCLQLLITLRCF